MAQPSGEPRALLQVAGVEKHFGDRSDAALSPIDLTVDAGELLTILGPSGCGKSTLLRIIAGLVIPSAGAIRWADGLRPKLGFVFQEPALMPWLSVEANVAEPLLLGRAPTGDVTAAVAEALARVGLSDFASAYPRELSGGMKMRTSIARALVAKPRFLLMDEPFAALDELTREQLNDDLLRLQRDEGLTIIFVTHSVQEAVFLSSRLIVISPRPGRILHDQRMGQDRGDDFRASLAFVETCRGVSNILRIRS